ncbi:hypothetical protein AAVH_17771 [Aphelenchoides avenae]|nr:hypothetical protein AAVH_17771 [Aphelenchus avenae]
MPEDLQAKVSSRKFAMQMPDCSNVSVCENCDGKLRSERLHKSSVDSQLSICHPILLAGSDGTDVSRRISLHMPDCTCLQLCDECTRKCRQHLPFPGSSTEEEEKTCLKRENAKRFHRSRALTDPSSQQKRFR